MSLPLAPRLFWHRALCISLLCVVVAALALYCAMGGPTQEQMVNSKNGGYAR